MTQIQQTQYEQALGLALINNIHILGKGTVKKTGQKFYIVSSSNGIDAYPVMVAGMTLTCTCKSRKAICTHRAWVRAHIMEAAAKKAAQAALDAQQECDRIAHEVLTGQDVYAERIIIRNDTGPRLYR